MFTLLKEGFTGECLKNRFDDFCDMGMQSVSVGVTRWVLLCGTPFSAIVVVFGTVFPDCQYVFSHLVCIVDTFESQRLSVPEFSLWLWG